MRLHQSGRMHAKMMRSRQRPASSAAQSCATWHPNHHIRASPVSATPSTPRSLSTASSESGTDAANVIEAVSRRGTLLASLLVMGASWMEPRTAAAAAAATEEFFTYVPNTTKTPAIRAGLIREPFYSMLVPTSWKEAKIPNIVSGNFCMPSCGEPWVEVVFENPQEGKLQLLVSPLVKLTNKKNLPIQDLGTPEDILPRIGGYITGTFMEEEDLVTFTTKVQDDGLTYYYYELYAPAANGHSLTAVTNKGDGCYLFVCSASDKAWKSSEPLLRKTVEAFRA